MIVCDICETDVAIVKRDRRVFGLMPVEVGTFSYSKAEWQTIDAEEGSGMAYFLHGGCLDDVIQQSREMKTPVKTEMEGQQLPLFRNGREVINALNGEEI